MSTDFLDSNIFVYTFDDRDPRKRRIAESVIAELSERETAVVSYQVVQEVLNVLTGKMARTIPAAVARAYVIDIVSPLWRVGPSLGLYLRALDLRQRYPLSFYDACIVAGALEAGCERLLSEDMDNMPEIDGLSVVNPFA
jgi:predicted nucleic acid-binding protein